jgi:hypothetical protein
LDLFDPSARVPSSSAEYTGDGEETDMTTTSDDTHPAVGGGRWILESAVD